MIGQREKKSKVRWVTRPITVQKTKFEPENKLFKTFKFGAYLLISDFLAESLKPNKN